MLFSPRLLAVMAAALLVCLAPVPAAAQADSEVSTSEQVAIAFFKTADTNPDFELWAKNNPDYNRQSATRAGDYVFNEKQRLIKLWRNYDPDQDLLGIKTAVDVELKAVNDKDGNPTYWMYMSFASGNPGYFPYQFNEYKFALIPQMLEQLMIQQVTPQQYQMMQEEFTTTGSRLANLYIQMKPEKAYINQPYNIDNMNQWAFITNIVSLMLRSNSNDNVFWNYGAQWYVSPRTKEVQDLYQAPSAGP